MWHLTYLDTQRRFTVKSVIAILVQLNTHADDGELIVNTAALAQCGLTKTDIVLSSLLTTTSRQDRLGFLSKDTTTEVDVAQTGNPPITGRNPTTIATINQHVDKYRISFLFPSTRVTLL